MVTSLDLVLYPTLQTGGLSMGQYIQYRTYSIVHTVHTAYFLTLSASSILKSKY